MAPAAFRLVSTCSTSWSPRSRHWTALHPSFCQRAIDRGWLQTLFQPTLPLDTRTCSSSIWQYTTSIAASRTSRAAGNLDIWAGHRALVGLWLCMATGHYLHQPAASPVPSSWLPSPKATGPIAASRPWTRTRRYISRSCVFSACPLRWATSTPLVLLSTSCGHTPRRSARRFSSAPLRLSSTTSYLCC